MKLSSLYSNRPAELTRIDFRDGLNVVLGEIRLPENKDRDTHNLGKTTLGGLIDFCLLKGRSSEFFLFRHATTFSPFVFFIEIALENGSFVTVRRSASTHTRIGIKRHSQRREDYSALQQEEWDHWNLPLAKAKTILDGILDLGALAPFDYRKEMPYLLRSQDSYRSVFKVQNASTRDVVWKPFLAHILGFEAASIRDVYEAEVALDQKNGQVAVIHAESSLNSSGLADIEGLLRIKTQDLRKRELLLAEFDFGAEDADRTTELVDDIDLRTANLNEERYGLTKRLKKVELALVEREINFDVAEVSALFEEASVIFEGQIVRDFESLIRFNQQIGTERRGYLEEEQADLVAALANVESELEILGARRTELLSFLSNSDSLAKYREVSQQLVGLTSEIAVLNQKKEALSRIDELSADRQAAEAEVTRKKGVLSDELKAQIEDTDSLFWQIQDRFNDIIYTVTGSHALLSARLNGEGHVDFSAEILNQKDTATSQGRGNTYKKLMCMAFDLAVLSAHLGSGFPRFVYHDGAFESLDSRKKEKLVEVYREHAALGIQIIMTAIDSDLPPSSTSGVHLLNPDEIVLTLHDEGTSGRLFKIPSW
ncbi:DUF2326 domain-containing protein [Pseudarthrobacter oxydans]|uniref:DUF2326 domain-containing protein n=1 Tax=Pseudarthrobacter oxydans TaxID=1671 RepID=UPI001FE5B977|nr:DUF2326 domain-containing protein [Pseudarthrobacter oxydans]